ncbi:autotransporter outer membrane beta-barrel domain-containing protein [Hyphomicrobium sulfonivorans]|uniref:autotransporter outer membrane beta-barrel domain-containing protein n=2 Tax=Hyphomicrobium sulfonivorans TaxID=121290 RepID=UPI001570E288|nr:autotransporter outer membrane beta-barrel domain-containing protein [Hyphomicrobium sulfonivorans]
MTLLSLLASPAGAQQVFADGTTETATGTIDTSPDPAPTGIALYAINGGIIQSNTPLTIITDGILADGAFADSSTITIAGGSSITVTGASASGFRIQGATANINATGTTVNVADGFGAYVDNGATLTMSGGSITSMSERALRAVSGSSVTISGVALDTLGVASTVHASGFGTLVTLINSTVSGTGDGIVIDADANIDLRGTLVNASEMGLIFGGSSATIRDGSNIISNTPGDHAILLNSIGSSTLNILESTVTSNGISAATIANAGGANFATITLSTLTATSGAVLQSFGGSLDATLFDVDASGTQNLLDVFAGTLNVTAFGSTLTGSAVTAAGGVSNLDLQSTDWTVTGDSNVTSLTNGAGSLVHFTPPASSAGPFKALTTVNYVGQGGTLGINTVLGADGSPSDQLIIDGGMGSGTSQLAVNDVGGGGDLTQLNGILVVDAINGGTTVPGLFALAAPVVAGPYEYSLYRGSVDATNPDAWFLRSVLDCALDPSAPICAPDTPDYRQETSLYAAVPAMTLLYGRLMLDTLHERRGTAVSAYAEGAPNAAWARVIGRHGDRDGGKGGIYGAGPKYDYDFWAFQGGIDLYRDGDVGTSRNHAGAFFAIGHGSGDVQHIGDGKAGENSFMAYSWGAYWTHYTPENAYVDALLLGSWYDIDAKSNRIPKMKTDGGAFGASLEGGYPVYTGPDGFSIEPQAQLAYQTVNLNNGSDAAAQVHFDNVNSLVGRVGVRFTQDFGTPTWLSGAPSTFTAWIRPNFWYEFLGDPKTKFSSATSFIPFAADMGGTTFEINTGFSTDIGDGAAIYANASYLVGIGEHADGNAYDGKLGVKVAW